MTRFFCCNLLAHYSCVLNKKSDFLKKNYILIILVDFYVRLSRFFLLPGSSQMIRTRNTAVFIPAFPYKVWILFLISGFWFLSPTGGGGQVRLYSPDSILIQLKWTLLEVLVLNVQIYKSHNLGVTCTTDQAVALAMMPRIR